MYLLRPGVMPVLRRVALPAMAVFAAASLTGGCSSRPDGTTSFIWSNQQAYHVAAAPPRPVEMEDDGREAQVAPPASIRKQPDDPREPYSPNYGSATPASPVTTPARAAAARAASAAAPEPAATGTMSRDTSPGMSRGMSRDAVPDDLPPAFRRRLASAVGQD